MQHQLSGQEQAQALIVSHGPELPRAGFKTRRQAVPSLLASESAADCLCHTEPGHEASVKFRKAANDSLGCAETLN